MMKTLNQLKSAWPGRLAGFLFWSVLFCVVYGQSPLYTSNQNQYYLHGLARAGFGYLSADWLAGTLDPLPVFSALIEWTYRLFHSAAPTYFYYALLMGVYFFSLLGIADSIFRLNASRTGRALFALLLIGMHSAATRYFLSQVIGAGDPFLLEGGVAGQRVLGQVFQPSSFGVFLLLSIHLFLRKRRFLALIPLSAAVCFHSTYLLPAALLTAAYMIVTILEERRLGPAIRIGLAALLLVAPFLAYTLYVYWPTSPETGRQASELLARVRIPHHAIVADWFDWTVIAKLAFVAAALWLVRRTRLFAILLVLIAGSLSLTVAQILTGSDSLALLFPWRVSVIVVPLAAGLLLAALASRLANSPGIERLLSRRWAAAAGAALLLALALIGIARFRVESARGASAEERPLMEFVAETVRPGDVYLIPVKIEEFRLATGAPIYVDFKSIPYRDAEVLEWDRRIRLADTFFRNPEIDPCAYLDLFAREAGVTRVALPAGAPAAACPQLESLYQDNAYQLYALTGR